MDWEILTLTSTGHSRSSLKKVPFSCGTKETDKQLDEYLKQYSWKNHEIGLAKTFTACLKDDHKKILGYYSLSASLIESLELPELVKVKLPGYPIPSILLGKLAVDTSSQRQGIGKKLLTHAYQTAIEISTKIGVFAIRTDAKDEEAKSFYTRCGFHQLEDRDLGLFIPIEELREAQRQKQQSVMSITL